MSARVAVIGAGHQGLVAAIGLAAGGCDVVVLECADAPGCAVRTAELTLPGFRHDTCSGFFPLTAASPAFRDLDLDVPWIEPTVPMVHVLDGGEEITLHRDVDHTVQSLEACARGAGAAWHRLIGALWPHRERLTSAALAPLPSVAAWTALLARL